MASAMEQGSADLIGQLPGFLVGVDDAEAAQIYQVFFVDSVDMTVLGSELAGASLVVDSISEALGQFASFILETLAVSGLQDKNIWLNRLASTVKPDSAAAKDIARLGANVPDFSLSYTNYSPDKFAMTWQCTVSTLIDAIITFPAASLTPGDAESLSWEQHASTLASGLTDGWISAQAPNGNFFAVNIHVLLQIGPVG